MTEPPRLCCLEIWSSSLVRCTAGRTSEMDRPVSDRREEVVQKHFKIPPLNPGAFAVALPSGPVKINGKTIEESGIQAFKMF